ncbi:MAG: hypothetical protein QOE31_2431 [Solirubrobacteraceae bacterium]|jgi:hypothetical protein|nr:hypothetical protein [Solirubrobacteraceae bacterium]
MFTPKTDPVADDVAGSVNGTLQRQDTVTFHGWLGPGAEENTFRLFLHPWFHTWLELKSTDMVAQILGEDSADGASIVWVKRDAQITRCESGDALHFAKAVAEAQADGDGAGYYPKY